METTKISDSISTFAAHCREMAAKMVRPMVDAKTAVKNISDFYSEDKDGRLHITKINLSKMNDAEALERHGNDPNVRLDECGFPGSRQERKFLLEHDFKGTVETVIEQLRKRKWIYAYGKVGRGKSALMTRVIWELLKDRPSSKASFISVNDYARNAVSRQNRADAAVRRGEEMDQDTGGDRLRNLALLDDFDKANFSNEFIGRMVLDLIERLKKPNAKGKRPWILITSQLSIDELEKRHASNPDMEPLCDRLRQMCHVLPKFEGESFR
ncbi:MAG: hypothetical protein RTU92_02615 [Candidatus Thorarchaeota archaeon]